MYGTLTKAAVDHLPVNSSSTRHLTAKQTRGGDMSAKNKNCQGLFINRRTGEQLRCEGANDQDRRVTTVFPSIAFFCFLVSWGRIVAAPPKTPCTPSSAPSRLGAGTNRFDYQIPFPLKFATRIQGENGTSAAESLAASLLSVRTPRNTASPCTCGGSGTHCNVHISVTHSESQGATVVSSSADSKGTGAVCG